MSKQTTTEKQAIRRMTILRICRKTAIILGVAAAMFCFNIVYEPFVQSQVNYNILPEPAPPNPEISIVAEYQTKRNSKLPEEIAKLQAELLVETAAKNKLPVSLIVAMAETESTFNPFEQSSVGAKGLMQVYQSARVEIDHKQAYNLTYNIQKGCEVLLEKLDNNNQNLPRALAAYSGNAKDYTDKVYLNVGRYEMFKYRQLEVTR